jgi:uncharacterized protein YfaT (DUF1175 family)
MRSVQNFFSAVFFLLLFCTAGIRYAFADTMTPAQAQVLREQFVQEAKKYVGSPYAYGGRGPDSFDCSGFVDYVAHVSIQYELARTAQAMYSNARIIRDDDREIGDLVFFKTTNDGSISHVGIYIGKQQFVHAASNGPNQGVIVSSLNELYWHDHYSATGQFLQSGRDKDDNNTGGEPDQINGAAPVLSVGNGTGGTIQSIADNLMLEASLTADWSLFTMNRFMPDFRGVSLLSYVSYNGWPLVPGAGILLRYNAGVKAFQVPVVFGLSFNDYVRFFAGPVFTMGTCTEPGTDERISSSVFPGIIGFSFQTPSITRGRVKVTIIQDISYTVYNWMDNAALPFVESMAAGLEFSTGIRVIFPLSLFTK